MCDAHRDQVWSEEHRDYVVLCTNGWEVEVRDGMTVTLGRYPTESPWAHHLTEEKFVSRRHASLTSRDGKLVVRDHNSRNGTRVRGVRIEPEVEHVLVPGDQLRLGGKVDFYVR